MRESFEKQKAIDVALSKLTTDEKILLGLVKKQVKPKINKNYKLKIYYMLGRSDNYTTNEATISITNPFLKTITNAIDKLIIPSDSCGLSLEREDYEYNYNLKNISKFEFDLLCLVSNCYDEKLANDFIKEYEFDNIELTRGYLDEFVGLLESYSEFTFLIYDSYKIK